MPKILIPTPLRQYTGKQDTVQVKGATVGESLTELTTQHQELRRNKGVTLAEASMNFTRRRQVFASSIGSVMNRGTPLLSSAVAQTNASKDH
jgi:molybdopterin converting factor small subunit